MNRDRATENRELGTVHSLTASDKNTVMIPWGLRFLLAVSQQMQRSHCWKMELWQGCRGAASKVGSLFSQGRRKLMVLSRSR